ncbi:sensor domain-containing diguanylate cyclase (plasmid) [Acuticoccus sp. MNP-M23]|uniref:GGDEF domain-containing protein n=1 Tax=Acuticoccus sp. MNP-M23 TaxID=3072793 RepID=UPI002814A7C5|nr:sensor domain-containing diguanylate cyclase [Acuticoccus sp. MNP-M23]WMS45315.1 sensor domain-containing diguanylate cyclase [Acuticoccus sp. MNP-M23]
MAGTKSVRIEDEFGRQCALDRLAVVETEPEPEFEKITALVKSIFDVPIAAVSLIDRDRQWFKSIQGLDVRETPRDVAFCDHTIRAGTCLKVEDAITDPRFRDNPLVTGAPHIRAYLGAPIVTADRYALGSLCAIDVRPRTFTMEQERLLLNFADLVMNQLELRQLATVDPLTGLATRRAFLDAMHKVVLEAERSGTPLSLICLDLDHFKLVNDRFGHPVGDAVLTATGRAVQSQLPDAAFGGRLGGEEMAVFLAGYDLDQACAIGERLRLAIESKTIPDQPDVAFTASLGVAQWDRNMTAETWMANADAALYQAKHTGRNRVASESVAMQTP